MSLYSGSIFLNNNLVIKAKATRLYITFDPVSPLGGSWQRREKGKINTINIATP